MIVGNLFQQLYVMVDTVILNRALGSDALSAVGCTGNITFWVLGIITGFITGLCVVISQHYGAGDEEGIKRGFAASIWLGAGASAVVTLISLLLTRPLLDMLHTPLEIIEDAQKYLSVLFGGLVANVIFNLSLGLMRALGDSRRALYFLILMCLLNTGLDYLFVCVFQMDVAGIALASVMAQLLAGACGFFCIRKKMPQFSIGRKHFARAKSEIGGCLRIALPLSFQTPIIGIGLLVMQYAINAQGMDAQTAYTAASRLEGFSEAIFASFGVTICTYVAQNYGAGRFDRIKKGVFQCLLIGLGVSLFFLFLHLWGGRLLLGSVIGIQDPQVLELSQSCLVYFSIANLFLMMIYVYRNALQGVGHTSMPVLAGFAESGARIFAATVLTGVFVYAEIKLANPLAWTIAGLLLAVTYYYTAHRKLSDKE